MIGDDKIVEFGEYCARCKHRDESPYEDPCWTCIGEPARPDSRRPEKWEEAK